MKISVQKLNVPPQNFLRQCGYLEISNPHKNNEISYARSLDPGRFYPRFHIYITDAKLSNANDAKTVQINLHLDMKKPSYEGVTAHSGEYHGELVEKESARIQTLAGKSLSQSTQLSPIGFKFKKSFWQKLKDIFTS